MAPDAPTTSANQPKSLYAIHGTSSWSASNPRRRKTCQFEKLKRGISQFGFLGVVAIDAEFKIWSGELRTGRAEVGIPLVPCVSVAHFNEARRRAYRNSITALRRHPARECAATLAEIRGEIGPTDYEAQYQQNPLPASGNVIKKDGRRTYTTLPPKGSGIDVQSWDTAMEGGATNDYSVCTTWRVVDSKIYLVDVFRRKVVPELVRVAVDLHKTYRPNIVLIEDHGSGTVLL